MRRFSWTDPVQRRFWLSLTETFINASASIEEELEKDYPDCDVLDKWCGAIQHDLNTLRYAYLNQLAFKPFPEIQSQPSKTNRADS